MRTCGHEVCDPEVCQERGTGVCVFGYSMAEREAAHKAEQEELMYYDGIRRREAARREQERLGKYEEDNIRYKDIYRFCGRWI